MPSSICLPLLCAAGFLLTGAGDLAADEDGASTFRKESEAFFEEHCLDCHDSTTTKGGFNLEKIDAAAINSPEQTDAWVRIYDRLARGEMPPAKKPQPGRAEVEHLLGALRPQLITVDRARRSVVQRRLNRIEYENTVHDLLSLGSEVELKHFLPEDREAGGFDNNGDALAISTEQMQGYLTAARTALDAAIVTGERPKTQTWTTDCASEVKHYIETGEFGYVDGRVVRFTTTGGDYSNISTRVKCPEVAGRYRFRFQAVAIENPDLGFFMVTAANFPGAPDRSRNLGIFDVGEEPKAFEVEAYIEAKGSIQFFALGLPGWVKPTPGVMHQGVGFGPVEITGPLNTQWPPASTSNLLGDVKLTSGTAADAEAILRRFLPRAFRRPVNDAEIERYLSLVRAKLDAGRNFNDSLRAGLMAVLCSPNFIYLREELRPGETRVSDSELACRLSYFLWSSMPDAELLKLGGEGRLHDPQTLRAQVERLLSDPRADAFVKNFTGQWLRLRRINDTLPDKKLYPKFDELIQDGMVREGEGFFREILAENLPITDFLDSDWAMLNQPLAKLYGVPGVSGAAMRKVKLPPDSVRGGVLTQAGVLKVTANGTTTSPVLRGVWVLENILGHPTPPPPPNAGNIEPDTRGATTIREQLDKHRRSESCAVCHSKIDPPGFALESFDPIGERREKYLRWVVTDAKNGWGRVEPGKPVDASGKLASGEEFADVREFKKLLLAHSNAFARCLTEKLFTYALGRELGFSDRDAIDALVKQTAKEGNGVRSLIHSIAESDIFATR